MSRTPFDEQLQTASNILEQAYGIRPRPVYREGGGIQAFGFEVGGTGSGTVMEPERSYTLGELAMAPDYNPDAREIFKAHIEKSSGGVPVEKHGDELWLMKAGDDAEALIVWAAEVKKAAQTRIGAGRKLKEYNAKFLQDAGIYDKSETAIMLATLTDQNLIRDFRSRAIAYLRQDNAAPGFVADMEEFFATKTRAGSHIDSDNLGRACYASMDRHHLNSGEDSTRKNELNNMLNSFMGVQSQQERKRREEGEELG